MSICGAGIDTDTELLEVLTRPSGAGRWRKLGTVRGWGEAVRLMAACLGRRGSEYWFRRIAEESDTDGPTLFDDDGPEPAGDYPAG